MGDGIAGIDHVIIAVRDLERGRAAWTRLGFTLSPRGRHIGRGTGNYCIMFPSDYLELMGIVDAADSVERLAAFLERREGLMAAAFAPAGTAEEARAALLHRGLHPSEPRPLARRTELPTETLMPRFSLIALPPEETPGLDSFLCSHLTPELMRRPEWLVHPNGAQRLNAIHVLVDSTAPLLAAYDRLVGIVQVTTTDAVAAVHVGRQRIVFATPDDFRTMHPGLELDSGFPLPGIAAIELGVERLGETADYLTRGGIAFARMPDGDLGIASSEATGALVLLTEG
jgi:catechol 2,3-dioxygenase-like lactoylglutathione lyase family enzyme